MIVVIIIISLVLRLISINQSLWLDEAINVNNASSLDLKSLIFNYSLSDFHPPLFHIILKIWTDFFGNSEIAVRIPSVIFGVLTVLVIYLIGKKLFEKKTALVAATLLATAPLHIYYSQEARMYALAALCASTSVYFFISIIKKDSLTLWVGFIVSTVVMLYSDYLPYLMIPIYFIYLLVNRKKILATTLKAFIPAFIIIFILISPWLLLLPSQAKIGLSAAAASPAWATVVGSPQAKDLALTFVKFSIGRISHDNNYLYLLFFLPVGLYFIFLLIFSLLRISTQRLFLWYWLAGPILLGFLLAYFVPIFAYFRFLFVLPAFYLILASAIIPIHWTPLIRLLLAVTLTINLTSTVIYFTNPKFHRENWRDATNYVISNSTATSITIFESNYTVGPFDYYNHSQVSASGALDSFNPDETKVKEKVKILTENKNHVYLFQYLSEITDEQGLIYRELTQLDFANTKTLDFNGVGFIYEFKKSVK